MWACSVPRRLRTNGDDVSAPRTPSDPVPKTCADPGSSTAKVRHSPYRSPLHKGVQSDTSSRSSKRASKLSSLTISMPELDQFRRTGAAIHLESCRGNWHPRCSARPPSHDTHFPHRRARSRPASACADPGGAARVVWRHAGSSDVNGLAAELAFGSSWPSFPSRRRCDRQRG